MIFCYFQWCGTHGTVFKNKSDKSTYWLFQILCFCYFGGFCVRTLNLTVFVWRFLYLYYMYQNCQKYFFFKSHKNFCSKIKKNFSRIDPEWISASPGQSSSTLRERGCFERTREIRERKILELETSRLHRDHGRVGVADLRRGCDATGEHFHFAF